MAAVHLEHMLWAQKEEEKEGQNQMLKTYNILDEWMSMVYFWNETDNGN
jgi:hypothetical protein